MVAATIAVLPAAIRQVYVAGLKKRRRIPLPHTEDNEVSKGQRRRPRRIVENLELLNYLLEAVVPAERKIYASVRAPFAVGATTTERIVERQTNKGADVVAEKAGIARDAVLREGSSPSGSPVQW